MDIRNLFLKKAIAIITIFAIIMVQYVTIGITAITYAVDMIVTNNDNVQFRAYFITENVGEQPIETTSVKKVTNSSGIKLNIDISVKNEGYFNGQISLEDASFAFKEDILSENIEKIENNIIYLKKINADETVKIQVGIKIIEDREIDVSYLNKSNKIKLTGTYHSSKPDKEIVGESYVTIDWNMYENISAYLQARLLTNSVYKVNNENKRIVQLLVISSLGSNAFPVKNTELLLNIPERASNISVHKRTTIATNGNKDFSESNYNVENNTLKINISNNEENGKINWARKGSDELVVTYEFAENEDITNTTINVNSNLTTYETNEETGNYVVYSGEQKQITLNKEEKGIITTEKWKKEPEIYKGKIYSGEEKQYITYAKMYVDYVDAIQEVGITESEFKFSKPELDENNQEISVEKDANIEYRKITFSKDNINSLLGQTWNITVTNQNNNVKTITNETQANENGLIEIELDDGTKQIKLNMTKPINNGILDYMLTKSILENNYTRAEIKEFTKIIETSGVQYKKNDNNTTTITKMTPINLKEPESKASLNISQMKLSTLKTNENIELVAKLNTNNETMNLYKNPIIDIVLPKEVEKVNVRQFSQLLYTNGLEIAENKVYKKEDGRLAIWIKFNGEQTKYDTNGGTEAHLFLDIDINKLTPNKNSKIEMFYTNDFDGTNAKIEKGITLESQYGLMLCSNVNTDISIGEEDMTLKVEKNIENKEIILETNLLNNYDEKITNLSLIGKMPVKNEINTFGASLKSISLNNGAARIYFSKNINATKDDNSWSENSEGAIAYKIVLDELNSSELLNVKTRILLPNNLGNNQIANIISQIECMNGNDTIKKAKKVILYTDETIQNNENYEGQNINILEGLSAKIITKTGTSELKNEDNVYEGSTIKYNITFTNKTGNDINNINIKSTQENGKVWENVEKEVYNQNYGKTFKEYFYELSNKNEIYFEKIASLKNGNSITVEYEVTVDKVTDESKKTYGIININTDDGQINKNLKTIENNIKDGELQLLLIQNDSEENYWLSNSSASAELDINNLGNNELANVTIKILMSKDLSCDKYEDYIDLKDYSDRITLERKEKNSDGETIITLKIVKINPEESIKLYLNPYINDFSEDETKLSILAQGVTSESKVYYSNLLNRVGYVSKRNMEIKQEVYSNDKKLGDNEIIKNGQEVEFVSTISNKSEKKKKINISNGFKTGVELKNVTVIKNNIPIDKTSEIKDNAISLNTDINANETIIIREKVSIDTVSLYSAKYENEITVSDLETLKNYRSTITINTDKTIDEEEKEIEPERPDENTDDETDNTQGEEENNDEQKNDEDEKKTDYYKVSGIAWVDDNNNGKMDSNEERKSGIQVKAIDSSTGKYIENTAQTNENGEYSLEMAKGKYVIVFLFDTNKYLLTTYKAKDVDEVLNSDIVTRIITIDNEEIKTGSSDELSVNSNIENINIGLINKGEFDVKLQKYVSKVTTVNKAGTKTKSFNENSSIPKVEIRSKYLEGSKVYIEYTFKVTNIGKVSGYAGSIIDDIPESLKYDKSLNSEWEEKDGKLYNKTLNKNELKAGESIEVKLVLTKEMTNSNTGLINNTAIISNSKDNNGISENNLDNNESSADVIITVSTGKIITYIAISLLITCSIIFGVIVAIKKYTNKKIYTGGK